MTADEELDWIRDRIAMGESPEQIVDELVGSEWTESGARQAVWQAVGQGIEDAKDACLLCKVVPVVFSTLALIIALGVAFTVFTGAPIAEPGPTAPSNGSDPGTSVSSERAFGIVNGTIPEIDGGPAPMLLRVANNDPEAYTLLVGEDSYDLPADDATTIRLEQSGTYTLTLEETGSERTLTVE